MINVAGMGKKVFSFFKVWNCEWKMSYTSYLYMILDDSIYNIRFTIRSRDITNDTNKRKINEINDL